MALVDLISPDIIKIPLQSSNKPEVLRELVHVLKDSGRIDDYDGVLEAIKAREEKQSTGLESGIAVPHAKSPAVASLKMAIGIAPQGIEFNAMDGNPSTLFFMLVAPPDQSGPHVEALAEIAKLAQSKAVLKALVNADSAEEVVELLVEE
ncbi:MAG: PTS sugar transporter subunit IIA [Chitinivibrionales bacterium]|nr:PTS sugar transporter subunit IIA [Chitinivibrionales bacterium]